MDHYRHLTTEERESTMVLCEQGVSLRAIARILGRSPATVSRELHRNKKADGLTALITPQGNIVNVASDVAVNPLWRTRN